MKPDRSYQTIGAQFLANRPRAILADDMGLGKSRQAVRACDLVGAQRVAVVCPASVRVSWEREFEGAQQRQRSVGVASRARFKAVDVAIASYETADLLDHGNYDAIILDEAHYAKNPKAKRTERLYGAGCSGVGGLIGRGRRVWALTGTPVPNRPNDIWPTVRALVPDAIRDKQDRVMNYWQFTKRFCRVVNTGFGQKIVGARNIPELTERLRPFMLRRLKEDVLEDLPPVSYEELLLDAGDAATSLAELEASEEGQALRAALDALAAGNATRADKKLLQSGDLRRLMAKAKVRPLVEQVLDDFDCGMAKIVLFAWHREVIDAIAAALPEWAGVVVVDGSTAPTARQKAVDRFQSDPKCRVFLGQIVAAGTGLTLTAACEVLFAELSWRPGDNAQASMRCARLGQMWPVRVRFASLAGTVDERVTDTLRVKTRDVVALLDPYKGKELSLAEMLA